MLWVSEVTKKDEVSMVEEEDIPGYSEAVELATQLTFATGVVYTALPVWRCALYGFCGRRAAITVQQPKTGTMMDADSIAYVGLLDTLICFWWGCLPLSNNIVDCDVH